MTIFGRYLLVLAIQATLLIVAFLIGRRQGLQIGRKTDCGIGKKMQDCTNEELSQLDDLVVSEIERRLKLGLKARRIHTSPFRGDDENPFSEFEDEKCNKG